MINPNYLPMCISILISFLRHCRFWVLAATAMVLIVLCATQPIFTHSAQAAADSPIYADALAGGWQDWSWNTTRDFNNAQPVHSGSASIAVTYTTQWGGLLLHTATALPVSDYSAIRFWVHGGSTGGQSVNFHVTDGGVSYAFTVQANTWVSVTVPFAALGNPTTLSDLYWQDGSGGAQPTYYLDDIGLIGRPPFNGWLVLNGTDKYALAPYQSELDLRGGSFTVEMWLKLADDVVSTSSYIVYPLRQLSSFKFLIEKDQITDNSHFPPTYTYKYCNHFVLYPDSGSCWWVGSDTGTFLGTSWGHLAGVYDKAAGESRLYWNGQIMESVAASQSTDMPGELSINYWPGAGSNLLGLVDEVRISDIVRYSGNFTPPTTPFVCDANTRALWHFDEISGTTSFHDACGAVDNVLVGYNGAHTEGVPLVPITAVTIGGPITGTTNASYSFSTTVSPITLTMPITYTWSPMPNTGQGTPSAIYSWLTDGNKTITVTAENMGGIVTDTHTITIGEQYLIYLPLIRR